MEYAWESLQKITERINKKNITVTIILEIISIYRKIYKLIKAKYYLSNNEISKLEELFIIKFLIEGCLYEMPNVEIILEKVIIPSVINITREIDRLSSIYYEKILQKMIEHFKNTKSLSVRLPLKEKEILLNICHMITYLIINSIEELLIDCLENNPQISEDKEIEDTIKMATEFKDLASKVIKFLS